MALRNSVYAIESLRIRMCCRQRNARRRCDRLNNVCSNHRPNAADKRTLRIRMTHLTTRLRIAISALAAAFQLEMTFAQKRRSIDLTDRTPMRL